MNIKIICKMSIKTLKSTNSGRTCNVFVVCDDMIADLISNTKLKQIVTELFIRRTKLNIFTVFIMQSYFSVPRDFRLNFTHFL